MTMVRPARLDDLDGLVGLFRGYLDFYGEPAHEHDVAAYLTGHLEAGTSTILVAELDDELVGFTQLYPTWESLSMTSRWILYDLFVASHVRRRGAGRALMLAALDHARASGAGSVSLDTARDNAPAQALYEALGFERDDEFVTFHHELASD
jgi:ribosomal protein S18 acetylase RimI-like enzyme